IILGVLAAGGSNHILVATVLAASFAESLSMGAVAYTSAMSQKDHYEAEKAKAKHEIEKYPAMEAEEVREIFEQKGFKGKVLDEIVDTITADKTIWLNTMVTEELQLQPVDTRSVLKSSVIVTIATGIGHLIPLLPFFITFGQSGLIASVIVSAITLFAVGVYQALTLVGSWWKMGLKLVAIGLIAAFAGYLIATLFHVSAG